MGMPEYVLSFDSLSLTASDLFAEMGYGDQEPEGEVRALTISMLEEVSQWVAPRCSFSVWNGRTEADAVCLNEDDRFPVGPVIASLLKKATRFALFTATVGAAYQQFQEQLGKEGDMVKVFIADIIGSCIVEKAGDCLERLLATKERGERHTNRFSPGYCGWHLTGQKQLFRLMGETPCGIRLSEVCLMMPIKSISGIIGIGPDVDERTYGCQYCELETCYKRKKKHT